MSLFDELVRTELRTRRQNEGAFHYLNSSARPAISAIRDVLESWFSRLPEHAEADIRGRFRKDDPVQHSSAFFELFWHELVCRAGYEVSVHPRIAGATATPDFLASRDGRPVFYLEATLAMPAGDLAADRRFAELHNTLNQMTSPDFYLEIEYRGLPQANVNGRVVRNELERWLRGISYEDIRRLYEAGDYDAVPSLSLDAQGAVLTFSPIPKGPEMRGRRDVRPVGIVAPAELDIVRTHEDIRAAVEAKANKYGALGLPLIVAVNAMADFCMEQEVWNALFGQEQIVATRQADGTWQHQWGTRATNGAWCGPRGPRNRLASAVIVTNQLSPSTLHACLPWFVQNPWADHPLAPDALPLAQCEISHTDGTIQRRAGASPGELLGIPEPWPVSD